mmetsp:Transcript_73713/g.210110  ORF Transcript_73713/g.210110 Transcript_73713/m.210110 type:complete len:156 (+) Transcript_73713:626-1093(+)
MTDSIQDPSTLPTIPFLEVCRDFVSVQRVLGGPAMAKSADELEQNIRLCEEFIRCEEEGTCETLGDIFELEKQRGIHGRGGILCDPSMACSILWIRRSIAIQITGISILLKVTLLSHYGESAESAESAEGVEASPPLNVCVAVATTAHYLPSTPL